MSSTSTVSLPPAPAGTGLFRPGEEFGLAEANAVTLRPLAGEPCQRAGAQGGSRPQGVSLVIPAYNEAARIERTLERYLPVLRALREPYEVIVVDDGHDGTGDVVGKYASSGVIYLQQPTKMGKGGAVLTGMRASRFDTIGHVDADGSLSAADLGRLIDMVRRFDCVIGSRWVPGSRWIRREPRLKRFASRGFNVLTRGLLGLPLADTQCGAKFYQARLLDRLIREVDVTNVTMDVSFLYHARRSGAQILEVPVEWDDDPRSRWNLPILVVFMFITVVGIRIMSLPIGRFVPPSFVARVRALLAAI